MVPSTISPARKDGRPQYYDVAIGDKMPCAVCLENGNDALYGQREIFICDPANSPRNDGGVYTVCKHHIPDNSVIHDPFVNETRTKDGQNTWREADATTGIMPPDPKKMAGGPKRKGLRP